MAAWNVGRTGSHDPDGHHLRQTHQRKRSGSQSRPEYGQVFIPPSHRLERRVLLKNFALLLNLNLWPKWKCASLSFLNLSIGGL